MKENSFYSGNNVISYFLSFQRAVKACIIENCPEKMNCGQVNKNFIDLMYFIDFLKWWLGQKWLKI